MVLNNKKSGKIQNLLLTIYFFFAIFTPNFCIVPTRLIIFFINIIIIVLHLFFSKGKMQINSSVVSIFTSFAPFAIYYLILQIIRYVINYDVVYSDLYLQSLYSVFLTFVHSFIGFIAIYILYSNIKIYDEKQYIHLVYAIFIQLICVLLAFFFPSIKEAFIATIIRYSESEVVSAAIESYSYFRCYGLSSNLFDAFGYITSIMITIVFALGVSKRKFLYSFFAMVMLIIPLLNARTGIVLAVVGFFVVLCYHFNPKAYFKYILMGVVAIIIFYIVINRVGGSLKEWIDIGINETILFITEGNTSSGLYGQLFGEDLVFPKDIIFGAGAAPEELEGYIGIDVGYIQCLWRFGLIGTVLLFLGYINMFRTVYKKCFRLLDKCIIISVLLIFFIYLIKLYSISNSGGNILIFGIPAIILSRYSTYKYQR